MNKRIEAFDSPLLERRTSKERRREGSVKGQARERARTPRGRTLDDQITIEKHKFKGTDEEARASQEFLRKFEEEKRRKREERRREEQPRTMREQIQEVATGSGQRQTYQRVYPPVAWPEREMIAIPE